MDPPFGMNGHLPSDTWTTQDTGCMTGHCPHLSPQQGRHKAMNSALALLSLHQRWNPLSALKTANGQKPTYRKKERARNTARPGSDTAFMLETS